MHDSFVSVLSSGSCGNSFLVAKDDSAILVDAGISAREIERRMSLFGVEPSHLEAVVLTHEHTDHIRGVRRLCTEHGIGIYATKGTLSLTPHNGIESVVIRAGQEARAGDFVLRPFSVMHLAAEPVAFRIEIGGSCVAIASDLGCVTDGIVRDMTGAGVLMVEANYDEAMLMNGGYPDFLKRAIHGKHGHLSNADAGMLSSETATRDSTDVVLVHLSKDNNTPELASSEVTETLKRKKKNLRLHVSEHGLPSGPYRLA